MLSFFFLSTMRSLKIALPELIEAPIHHLCSSCIAIAAQLTPSNSQRAQCNDDESLNPCLVAQHPRNHFFFLLLSLIDSRSLRPQQHICRWWLFEILLLIHGYICVQFTSPDVVSNAIHHPLVVDTLALCTYTLKIHKTIQKLPLPFLCSSGCLPAALRKELMLHKSWTHRTTSTILESCKYPLLLLLLLLVISIIHHHQHHNHLHQYTTPQLADRDICNLRDFSPFSIIHTT